MHGRTITFLILIKLFCLLLCDVLSLSKLQITLPLCLLLNFCTIEYFVMHMQLTDISHISVLTLQPPQFFHHCISNKHLSIFCIIKFRITAMPIRYCCSNTSTWPHTYIHIYRGDLIVWMKWLTSVGKIIVLVNLQPVHFCWIFQCIIN